MDIIEVVLVKVDKFIFLIDFLELDIMEDQYIPIILSRSVLSVGKALIVVQKCQLILKIQDEEISFNVFKAMIHPNEVDNCLRVDIVELYFSRYLTG